MKPEDKTYTLMILANSQSNMVLITCSYHPYLPHYISPTALSHMHHLTYGISSLLHSVNIILFTVP